MTMHTVAIIDYGSGNLRSATKAVERDLVGQISTGMSGLDDRVPAASPPEAG